MKPASLPNSTQEERLRALLGEAFPVDAPSPALRERIGNQSHMRTGAPSRPWYRSRLLQFAAACGAIATFGIVGVRYVAADPLRRVVQAVDRVPLIHTIGLQYGSDGKPVARILSWYNPEGTLYRSENYRLLPDGSSLLTDATVLKDGQRWFYQSVPNTVRITKQKSAFGHPGRTFTATELRQQLEKAMNEAHFQNQGVRIVDGRQMRQFLIEQEENSIPMRITLLVDTATDLPRSMQAQALRDGTWQDMGSNEMIYEGIDAQTIFRPDFPATAQVIDENAYRQRWADHLAKGIAEKTLSDGRKIVIRDLIVNFEGDVFLLYTAGKRFGDEFSTRQMWPGRDWKVRITDNLGNEYRPHGRQYFRPTLWGSSDGPAMPRPEDKLGFEFAGERLENDSWTPRKRQPLPWQPRMFTITFDASAINRHGDRKLDFPPDFSEQVHFTLPVSRPILSLLPEETRFADSESTEANLLADKAYIRNELPPGVKPSPELLRELPAQTDSVAALDFTPDGQSLTTSSWNSGIRNVDVGSGTLASMRGVSARDVVAVVYSPDGRSLLTRSNLFDGKRYVGAPLALWDRATGKCHWQVDLPSKNAGAGQTAFSPDGRTVFVTGFRADQTVRDGSGQQTMTRCSNWVQWRDAATGELQKTIRVPHGSFHPALDPVRLRVVTTSSETDSNHYFATSTVKVWRANTGILEKELPVPERAQVDEVAVSPNGKYIVGAGSYYPKQGGHDGHPALVVWDAETGMLLHHLPHVLDTPSVPPNSLTLSPDSRIAFLCIQNNVILVDFVRGERITTLVGHGQQAMQAAFSPDGSLLATGDLGGRILLWQVPQP